MNAFQYAQGFVKGLSPYEYRGKNPDFYKQRHRETARITQKSFEVEPQYKYLVPSKWHKTGWKYTELPKSTRPADQSPGYFLSTYSNSFQSPQAKNRQSSFTPRSSYSRPYSNWKLSSVRLSL